MAEHNTAVIGYAVLASTQAFTIFTQILPRLTDIRKARVETDHEFVGDVRYAEIVASIATIGTGAVISSLTRSRAPLIVSILTALGYVAVYEISLRKDMPMNPKPAAKGEKK